MNHKTTFLKRIFLFYIKQELLKINLIFLFFYLPSDGTQIKCIIERKKQNVNNNNRP